MSFYEMILQLGVSKFEVEVVVRLLIASICGAIIGLTNQRYQWCFIL